MSVPRTLQVLLDVVLPVFAVAGVGFWYAGRFAFPRRELAEMILRLTGACLVFDALTRSGRLAETGALTVLSGAAVVGGGLLLGTAFHGVLRTVAASGLRRGTPPPPPFAAVVLPVGFMNAGNLGLPLAELAYGEEGLALAMLFFITMSVLHYSVGVAIASGGAGWKDVFKLPLLYAAGAGLLVNQLELPVPPLVARPVGMLGQTVVPMMLLSLGASLRVLLPGTGATSREADSGPGLSLPFALSLLRIAGGALVGLGVVHAFGTAGTPLGEVTLLVATLPPAVLNFVIADRYGRRPALVAATIGVGTAVALVTTPLVLQ